MGFDLAGNSAGGYGDFSGELLDIIKGILQKLRQKKEWELFDYIRSKLNDLEIEIEDN